MPPYLRVQRYLRVDQVIIQLVNEHDQPSTAFGDFLILYSDGNAILLYVLIRCFVDGFENTTLRELEVSVIELLQPVYLFFVNSGCPSPLSGSRFRLCRWRRDYYLV